LATYQTLDNYPDLTADQMAGAVMLSLSPFESTFVAVAWDNYVLVSRGTYGDFGDIPDAFYRFNAIEGATYDFFVRSFGDPVVLLYDDQGNAIAENDESDDLESTQDIVWDWVAPYTGAYYIIPGWQLDETDPFSSFSLSISEDIDTAPNNTGGVAPSLAQTHLATYGVTVQQAKDFILSNTSQPAVIFSTAKQFGVTAPMLSEITGFSTDVIRGFFASFGMNTDELNGVIPPIIPSGHKLLPDNLSSLSHLIVFNANSGGLSTDALRANILPDAYEPDYAAVFNPSNYQGASDGVFSAEELGVAHLSNLPATRETMESLIYGTLINAFRAIDESEIFQIVLYLNSHPDPTDDTVTSEFITLMNGVFGDPSSDPVYRDDVQLARGVYQVTDGLIDDIMRNDFDDILITSLIGVTTVSMLELITTGRTDLFTDTGGVFL
jgi:hypothetical protein